MAKSNSNKSKVRSRATHCFYCERSFTDCIRTVDHILPICRGGNDALNNLVAACSDCNSTKNGFDIYEFRYIISKRIKHNEALGKIPNELLNTVRKNVIRLIRGYTPKIVKPEHLPTTPYPTGCELIKNTKRLTYYERHFDESETVREESIKNIRGRIKKPKLYPGEISTIPERATPIFIDPVSLRLKRERLKRIAKEDASNGYIYDESSKHICFHA